MAQKREEFPLDSSTVVTTGSPPPMKASEYLDAYKGWVYAAVNHVAETAASIPIKLYQKRVTRNEVEFKEIFDHPALSLLESANPFMTFTMLREMYHVYMQLLGEAVWGFIRQAKNIVEIWPLRPDWIKIKPSKDRLIDYYEYSPGGTFEPVKIDAENILLFKTFSPTNPYRGYGKVQASAMEIDIDDFSDEYNRNFFFNSAMPSFILNTEAKMSPENQKRFLEQFQQRFGGRRNSHKVAFLAGGKVEVKELSKGLQEMGYLDSKTFLRDKILSTFKVSKSNLGIVEDVNRANQEASDARFMKYVIKPEVSRFVNFLNEFYLPNFDPEGKQALFFNFEDPVPEDVETKIKIYESGLKNGWLTINEVREEESLEPVDGGDSVYLPFSMQPIGENATSTPPVDENGNPVKGIILKKKTKSKFKKKYKFAAPVPSFSKVKDLSDDIAKKIQPNLVKLIMKIMERKTDSELSSKELFNEDQKQLFWKELISSTDVQEVKLKKELLDLSSAQKDIVITNLGRFKKSMHILAKDITPSSIVFSLKEENKKWISILTPFIANTLSSRADDLFRQFGFDGDFILSDTEIEKFLTNEGVQFISEINNTTKKALVKTLREGFKKEESIASLTTRIGNVYDVFSKTRAQVIARTEVLRVNNFATEQVYKQSGVIEAKEWLTAEDERTCPWCGEMNGKVISVNNSFFKEGDTFNASDENGKQHKITFGFGDVNYPPLHPQCRCTLIPVISTRSSQGIKEKGKADIADNIAKDIIGKNKKK